MQWLVSTIRITQPFAGIFSAATSTERTSIELPEEFPKAWLHLLMSLVFNAKDMPRFEEQSSICTQLLAGGTRKVIQSLMQKGLLNYLVLRPFELASLINFQLLGDITQQSLDTSDTYFEYLSSLVSIFPGSATQLLTSS
jgi:hypothetical protein